MAIKTVWQPIDTAPVGRFFLVYKPIYEYAIRLIDDAGQWWDERDNPDDSLIDWDVWAELPDRPGKRDKGPEFWRLTPKAECDDFLERSRQHGDGDVDR